MYLMYPHQAQALMAMFRRDVDSFANAGVISRTDQALLFELVNKIDEIADDFPVTTAFKRLAEALTQTLGELHAIKRMELRWSREGSSGMRALELAMDSHMVDAVALLHGLDLTIVDHSKEFLIEYTESDPSVLVTLSPEPGESHAQCLVGTMAEINMLIAPCSRSSRVGESYTRRMLTFSG